MTELELIKFQLNMANNTINHLENTREIFLNKINELQKQNKILTEKLKIAEEALDKIISDDKCNRCDGIGNDLGCVDKDCEIYIAQEALQKMKEVQND